MINQLASSNMIMPLIIGFSSGILCRLLMLRTDYRQYPTYPHGRIIHIALGVIASLLGTVFVPSLLKQEYTAITFITLAAQQFRDVRNMERNTLAEIDKHELVPRGGAYIEGIAMVFEGRNYLVILTSLVTTFATVYFSWWGGMIAGVLVILLSLKLKTGNNLRHIAEIVPAEVNVNGKNLLVGDIYIMNVGSTDAQKKISEQGMGFILVPKNDNAAVTMSHPGQRQAILHDASTILGVYTDTGEPSLTPLIKRDLKTGRLGVFLLPASKDRDMAVKVLASVPILESAIRMPQKAQAKKQGGG